MTGHPPENGGPTADKPGPTAEKNAFPAEKDAPDKPKRKKGAGTANLKKLKKLDGKYVREKRLPDDFGGNRKHPIFTNTAQISEKLRLLDKSAGFAALEDACGDHPGKQSELPIKAFLAAAMVNAELNWTFLLTDITAVLAGTTAKAQAKLGLLCDDPEDAVPIGYNIVADQNDKIGELLWEGFEAKDGTWWDFARFIHSLIEASIPPHIAVAACAVAIDSTASQAWCATREHAQESKARAALADPDDPDYDEYRDVELGDDERVIRGADEHARSIYQTGTSKRIARVITGFFHYYSTLTRKVGYRGDPDHLEIGDPISNYIAGFTVSNKEDPEAGVAVYESAVDIAGEISQVHADIGFTKYIDRFLAPLRKRGTDIIMRQPVTALKHPKKVYLGKRKREFWYYCGYFLPPWLSEEDLLPPDNANPKTLEAHFARLARMALTRNDKLPGGMTQLECPQCTGRITSDRQTRKKNATVKPHAEHVLAETTADENGEILHCCESTTICINPREARHFQLPPYGTKAHRKASGYRNPAEKSNSSIKDKGGLEPGWCRMFRLPAQLLGGLMLVLAHNLGIRDPKPAPDQTPEHSPAPTSDNPNRVTPADADPAETARPPPPTA